MTEISSFSIPLRLWLRYQQALPSCLCLQKHRVQKQENKNTLITGQHDQSGENIPFDREREMWIENEISTKNN